MNKGLTIILFIAVCVILATVFGDPIGSNTTKTGCLEKGMFQSDSSYCVDLCMLNDNDAVRSIYEYFKTLPGADKFSKVPMPETEYHRDIKEAQSSPIELWLRQFVRDNFDLAYVDLSIMEIYESFNCFKSDSGIQFECSLVSFSLKLKNQKVDGVGESIHTKTGARRRFDIPKMKAHFGMGCLL